MVLSTKYPNIENVIILLKILGFQKLKPREKGKSPLRVSVLRFKEKINRTEQNKMFLKNSVTMRFNTSTIINIAVSQISSANNLKVNKSTTFNSHRYQTVLYASQETNIQSFRNFSIFNQKSINVSLFITLVTCLLLVFTMT